MFNKKPVLFALFLLIASALLFLANLLIGSNSFSIEASFKELFFGYSPVLKHVIWEIRLPQAVTSIVAGAALSVAGLLMQTLFRNPLAGPSVLGVSSGASVGVAVLMLTGFAGFSGGMFSGFAVIIAALLGALGLLSLILILSQRFDNLTLLIVGLMFSFAASAFIGMLQFFSGAEQLQSFVIWGLGSFAAVPPQQIFTFSLLILAGLLAVIPLLKPLNIMNVNELFLPQAGYSVKGVKRSVVLVAGFLTAIATAFCGPIAFIGLAVPHVVRTILNSADHKMLFINVLLGGGLFGLLCNLIVRFPLFNGVLPVSSVTSIMGAPLVIWLVIRKRNISF